ncbi:MAG TPA: hypothetical protein VMW69_14230, partial [Spirochaetia bacterium]|nr:hypothetical protein [Spirochaetia bacterium]
MGRIGWKRTAVLAMLIFGVAGLSFGQVRGHFALDMVANVQQIPSVDPSVTTFTTANQPVYWGLEFEAAHRHWGLGGLYSANLERINSNDYWLDFYGQAVYLSYHLFARRAFLDPYVSVGLGSAGRVAIGSGSTVTLPANQTILLSVFPVVSGGLALDLNGLYLGAKLSYLPSMTSLVATANSNVPLSKIQLV